MLFRRSIALAIFLISALSVPAATNVATVTELRSQFHPGEIHSVLFTLTGTVTHIARSSDTTNSHSIVFQDQTGTIQFFQQPFTPPVAGSKVIIRGHTTITSSGEPWTSEKVSVTSFGYEPPPAPPHVALAELDTPEMDLQTVRERQTFVVKQFAGIKQYIYTFRLY